MRIGARAIGGGAPLFVVAEIGLNHDGDPAPRAGARRRRGRRRRSRGQAPVAARRDARRPGSARAAARRSRTSTRRRCATCSRATSSTRRRTAPSPSAPGRTAWPGSRARSTRPPSTCWSASTADALKIASGDITHHRLIARAAATGKPLVISTGLSTLDEVAAAVTCAREGGARSLALLHCVSAYPTPDDQQNLARHPHARDRLRPARRPLRSHRATPPASPRRWRSAPASTSGTSRRRSPIR